MSAPRADVGDVSGAGALPGQPIEHGEAARRRVVAAGAERLARVDQEGRRAGRNAVGVAARMNEKSSCPHRLESLLAQRYPIFVGQLFDDGLLALRARDERGRKSVV